MSSRTLLTIAFSIIAINVAYGDRVIEQWNMSISSSKVTIDDGEGTILITGLAADTNEVFKFVCYDDGTDAPLDIESITVDSNIASGLVRVQVVSDGAPHTAGARDVWEINLSNATSSELVGVDITDDLGEVAGVTVDTVTGAVDVGGDVSTGFATTGNFGGDLTAATVTGANIHIGNNLTSGTTLDVGTMTGDIDIDGDTGPGAMIEVDDMTGDITVTGTLSGAVMGKISVGAMEGNIEVGTLSGDITAGSLTGDITLTTTSSTTLNGDITIQSTYSDTIAIPVNYSGTIKIEDPNMPVASLGSGGEITLDTTNRRFSGAIDIEGDLAGSITITGDLTDLRGPVTIGGAITSTGKIDVSKVLGRIDVTGDVTRTDEPPIHIRGPVTNSSAQSVPRITVGGTLNGVIAIDGALDDVNTSGAEIDVNAFASGAGAYPAIAVNYDGVDTDTDEWESGATIVVDSTPYSGNTPAASIYEVSSCMGDMNGDRVVDPNDGSPSEPNSPYAIALEDATVNMDSVHYAQKFPGLEGSRDYHGNCNGRSDGTQANFNSGDNGAFANLKSESCCSEPPSSRPILGDVDFDYDVDISDLGIVLSNFGLEGQQPYEGNVVSDVDDAVNISDLGQVLADFGDRECPSGTGGASQPGDFTLSVAAYDTSGYSGGGFEGEDEHFVFDAKIEVGEEDDDWTTAAAKIVPTNDAVLYILSDPNDPPVPGNTQPEKYATFFSVPKAVNAATRFTDPFPTGGLLEIA